MPLVAVSDCGGRRVSDSPIGDENALWNQFYNVLRDPSKRPSMGDDPLPWLIELRDIVIRMDDKSLPRIRHELGDNRWCQLIYLNIRKTDARTLVKTKVGKVDVSDWDLLPQETGISCKTCRGKWPCQLPNSLDTSKCRECYIQAKRCILPSPVSTSSIPRRKRKRSLPVAAIEIDQPPRSRLRRETLDSVLHSYDSLAAPSGLQEDHDSSPPTSDRRDLKQLLVASGHDVSDSDMALYRIWKQNRLSQREECTKEIVALVEKFSKDLKSSFERFCSTSSI